jgi:cell wall hydrolase
MPTYPIPADTNDLHSLALCAWKEARGEGIDGMRAVMHVICNRISTVGFPHSLHDVIYMKNQFTSMSVPSDPEFNLEPGANDAQYTYCVQVAPTVLAGTDPDNTLGARFYANLKTATSGWFFNNIVNNPTQHPQTAVVGHQTFFK